MVARNRIVISGTLGSQEVWSTSVSFGTDTSLVVGHTELADWAGTAWAYLEDTDNTGILLNALSQEGSITRVTAQYYGTDGVLIDQAFYSEAGGIDGLGTIQLPFQCAIVLSLRSESPSRSRRGRMYWPALGAGLATTGRLATPTAPGDLATQAASVLPGLAEAAPSIGLFPAIYSPKEGFVTPVTYVSVGDVVDTQRRRRDALVENYSNAPL